MSYLHEVMGMPWERPTDTVETPAALRAAHPEFPAVVTVRMPTAEDLACFDEAGDKVKNMQALVSALQAGGAGEKVAALSAAAGLDGQPNETYVRQIEMLLRCVVDPPVDREQVLWIGRTFPLLFRLLVRRIVALADGGAGLGKPNGSGPIQDSEPA